jgi:hypothetical protein
MSSLFSPSPAGPSQDVRYRQGIIVAFDPNTLANTVLIDGEEMTNLPLLGVGESTLLVPGSIVGIIVVGDAIRGKTLAILGRFVIPNTTDATDAVSLLNSQVYAAFVGTLEACSSSSLGDLATVGPSVTVPIGPTGRAVVIAGAETVVSGNSVAGAYTATGTMAVWLSGSNVFQPSAAASNGIMEHGVSAVLGTGTSLSSRGNPAVVTVYDGLAEGNTTFTLKYARNATTAFFLNRALTVIRL